MEEQPPSRQEAIFTEALATPPEQRRAFVERACGCDLRLRDEVSELLRGYEEHSAFLESTPAAAEPDVPVTALATGDHAIGDQIGRYRLLERIDEGARGVVYMAEQE